MANTQEVIQFTAEDKSLLASVKRMKDRIGDLHHKAKNIPGVMRKIGGSAKRSMDQGTKSTQSFSDSLKNVGKMAVLMAASFVAATRAMTAGMDKIESGLQKIVQIEMQSQFIGVAKAIRAAAIGMVDLNSAITIARRLSAIGLGKGVAITIGKSIAIAKLSGASLVKQEKITRQILKTFEELTVSAKAAEVLPEFAAAAKKMLKANSGLSDYNKKMQLAIILSKTLGKTIESSGDILNRPFAKLIGTIDKIREAMGGLQEVLSGTMMVVGGVVAPLAAGLGSFMFGPVVGAIGVIVGGILSGVLASTVIGAVEEGGDTSSAMEKTIGRLQLRYEILLNRLQTPAGETPKPFTVALDVPAILAGESFAEFASFADKLASGMKKAKGIWDDVTDAGAAGYLDTYRSVRGDFSNYAKGLRKDLGLSTERSAGSLSFGLQVGTYSVAAVIGGLVATLVNLGDLILILAETIADLITKGIVGLFKWDFWNSGTTTPAPANPRFKHGLEWTFGRDGPNGQKAGLQLDRLLFDVTPAFDPEIKSMLTAAGANGGAGTMDVGMFGNRPDIRNAKTIDNTEFMLGRVNHTLGKLDINLELILAGQQ